MTSTDRAVLVSLYRSTSGPGWKKKLNWDTDADLGTWFGVKLKDLGRVVELSLGNNNLRGVFRHLLLGRAFV